MAATPTRLKNLLKRFRARKVMTLAELAAHMRCSPRTDALFTSAANRRGTVDRKADVWPWQQVGIFRPTPRRLRSWSRPSSTHSSVLDSYAPASSDSGLSCRSRTL